MGTNLINSRNPILTGSTFEKQLSLALVCPPPPYTHLDTNTGIQNLIEKEFRT